jgi:hypothetical protein
MLSYSVTIHRRTGVNSGTLIHIGHEGVVVALEEYML